MEFYSHDLWTAYENDISTSKLPKLEDSRQAYVTQQYSAFKKAVDTIDLELKRRDEEMDPTGENSDIPKKAYPKYPEVGLFEAGVWNEQYTKLVKDLVIELKKQHSRKPPPEGKRPLIRELGSWHPKHTNQRGRKKNSTKPPKRPKNQSQKSSKKKEEKLKLLLLFLVFSYVCSSGCFVLIFC